MLSWLYHSIILKYLIEKGLIQSGQRENKTTLLLLKEIQDRTDLKFLWTSTIYLADVVFDWIYIETDLKSEPKASDTLVLFARIFAGIGTVLYTLDAFDLVQWFCKNRSRVRPIYVSLANLLLEDLAQASIAIYAAVYFKETRNATWGANLATTIFAIVTKFVNLRDSRQGYTIPGFLRFLDGDSSRAWVTIEFLIQEKMVINLSKLYDLKREVRRQVSEQAKGDKLQLNVKTDMPGGAHLVMQLIYKEQENKSVEITFEKDSFVDLPQLAAFANLTTKDYYHGAKTKSWKFDFRNCIIGSTAPDVKPKTRGWIELKDSNADCIVALLKYVGGQTNKVDLQIWQEQFKKVVLRPQIEQFDMQAFTGLCKLLETEKNLESLSIYNQRCLTANEIVSNSEYKKDSFISDYSSKDCAEMIQKMIHDAVLSNQDLCTKGIHVEWDDRIEGWGRHDDILNVTIVDYNWKTPSPVVEFLMKDYDLSGDCDPLELMEKN